MFITLEGIEGSGKTTQINNIDRFLEKKGHDCVITREPGGTKIGRKIRSILLDPENKGMEPMAELLLYFSDRVQHVETVINSALSEGKTVICDRYFDATLVYQGYARGLDMKLITRLHELVLEGLKPDITFLLDLSPEIGLSRAWKQIDNGSRTGDET
ncbi:MAG: dTMP kinase, partial [Desulfobacterales bacterium]|nr:dTMP kinase [Desulfobacterales bacterium]MDX2508654.1 dTMP kinase [Desulfobacterales bacterium]